MRGRVGRIALVGVGRVRVVPLDSSILYIQPLFLSADENPIPELWRVVVSDGRRVSMAETFQGAMAALGLPMAPEARASRAAASAGTGWPQRALDLLRAADERLWAGDWAGYGEALAELRALLERLNQDDSGGSEP